MIKQHLNGIVVAITHQSPMLTPVLSAVREFTSAAEAVKWINEHAQRWVDNHMAIVRASEGRGSFQVDGYPADGLPDVFFSKLTDELFLSANKGEELFTAAVDEESLHVLYHPKEQPLLLTAEKAYSIYKLLGDMEYAFDNEGDLKKDQWEDRVRHMASNIHIFMLDSDVDFKHFE